MQESINIYSWNTHGLENLTGNPGALEFLQKQDIILAQETWSTTPSYITGFTGHHELAIKSAKFGHPKGGLSSYFSTKLDWSVEKLPIGTNWALVTKLEQYKNNRTGKSLILNNVYIHPSKETKDEHMNMLVGILISLQRLYGQAQFIISGDFNINLCISPGNLNKKGNHFRRQLETLGLIHLN